MENSVLGNALDGVPEESEEEEPQPNDSNIESANNLDGQSKYNVPWVTVHVIQMFSSLVLQNDKMLLLIPYTFNYRPVQFSFLLEKKWEETFFFFLMMDIF